MSLNEYKLDTGFLSTEANSNQVIYLESDKTHIEQFALDHYVKKNLMEIKLLFSGYGLEFIHLSTWLDEQSNDDLMQYMRYYTPWIKSAYPYSLRRAYKRKIKELQRIWAPDTGNSAVIKGDGGAFEVYSVSPKLYYDLFVQIAKTWGHKIEHDNNIRFREARPDISFSLSPDDIHETCAEESQVLYQTITNPLDDEYAEADRMYLELKKKHPGWALKAILSAQLSKEEVISPIVINNPRNLILPEYNMEIHMAPATMAFYLLYLKHPEGIRFKDLIGYRNELCRFYNYTTKSDNKEKIAHAVNVMVAQLDGNQDTQRSRIKEAIRDSFKSYICEDLAKWYFLDGQRGEPMKIAVADQPGKVRFEVDL